MLVQRDYGLIMVEKFLFTDDILKRARALKAQGMRWAEVSKQLGCDAGHLQSALSREKHGKRRGMLTIWADRRKRREEAILAGKSIAEVARDEGVSVSAISETLTKLGLDKEVRDELSGKIQVPEV